MNYLALTIGPILSTLQQARKTKELWAASYLFSHLMNHLVAEIENQGGSVLTPQRTEVEQKELYGAGLFPDRLFAEANGLDEKKVKTAINEAIKKMAADVLPEGEDSTGAVDFWKKYLRIAWVIKSIENLSEENLYDTLAPYLDTAELTPTWFSLEPKDNCLLKLLENPYKTEVAKALHQKGNYDGLMKKGLFPSTADIATLELFQKNKDDYNQLRKEAEKEAKEEAQKKKNDETKIDEESDETLSIFYEKVFAKESPFKKTATDYHKYFCIVHGDGDNFGKTNAELKSKDDNIKFSEALAGFSAAAASIINDYGGKPIYIGGDDLLFFAPVCMKKGSVFKLIQALDVEFKNTKLNPRPTLSFGLTISHYKFPLFEARDLSYAQLDEGAKKFKRSNGVKKDAIAFRLLKHSGSYFEGVLTKPQLESFVEAEDKIRELKKDLLSSIMYKLETLEKLLGALAEKQALNNDRLSNLFKNFFNEPVHRQNPKQLELIQKLVLSIYSQQATVGKKSLNLNENLYAMLRLLKFITDKPLQNV